MPVKWYGNKVLAQVKLASKAMVTEAALLIEAQAKINVADNGQVDTGFMRQTIYAITPTADHYQSATHPDRPDHGTAPAAALPQDGAVVQAAAEYAFYQEQRQSFLYRAAQQVAATMADAIVVAGQDYLND